MLGEGNSVLLNLKIVYIWKICKRQRTFQLSFFPVISAKTPRACPVFLKVLEWEEGEDQRPLVREAAPALAGAQLVRASSPYGKVVGSISGQGHTKIDQ